MGGVSKEDEEESTNNEVGTCDNEENNKNGEEMKNKKDDNNDDDNDDDENDENDNNDNINCENENENNEKNGFNDEEKREEGGNNSNNKDKQQKSQHNNKVRFNDDRNETIDTISSYDFSTKEYETYWWDQNELIGIKQSCRNLRDKYPKLNFHDYSKDLRRNDSFRGLEMMDENYKNDRQSRYTKSQTAVFNKQREGQLLGNNGEQSTRTMIASKITPITDPGQIDAYERAKIDESVAKEMWKLIDDEKDNNHGNTNNNKSNKNNTEHSTTGKGKRGSILQRVNNRRKNKTISLDNLNFGFGGGEKDKSTTTTNDDDNHHNNKKGGRRNRQKQRSAPLMQFFNKSK